VFRPAGRARVAFGSSLRASRNSRRSSGAPFDERQHFRGFLQSTLQSGGRYDPSNFATPPATNSRSIRKAVHPDIRAVRATAQGAAEPRRAAHAVQDEQQRQAMAAGEA